MNALIRTIGNSKGLIIPKVIIDEFAADEVDIELVGGQIIISKKKTRQGWEAAIVNNNNGIAEMVLPENLESWEW